MDGDPVVEVDRIPHAPERTVPDPFNLPVELEHAAGCVRATAFAPDDRLFAVAVSILSRTDRDLFAPFFVRPRRHVRDQHRNIVLEHGQHLLGQVDLSVIRGGVRAPGLNREWFLHRVPHLGRDLPRRTVAVDAEDQLLVRPDSLDGLTAEDSVGWSGGKPEIGQSLLHLLNIGTRHSFCQRALDHRLSHGRRCFNCDDNFWRRIGNSQLSQLSGRHDVCVGATNVVASVAEGHTCHDHDRQYCQCSPSRQPLRDLMTLTRSIGGRGGGDLLVHDRDSIQGPGPWVKLSGHHTAGSA